MFYVLVLYVLSSSVLYSTVLITRRFLKNADAPTDGLELDCLYLAMESSIILNERPRYLERDLGFFFTQNIIAGPLNTKYICGTKLEIPGYPNVAETCNAVINF